jgi:hypothetical protein
MVLRMAMPDGYQPWRAGSIERPTDVIRRAHEGRLGVVTPRHEDDRRAHAGALVGLLALFFLFLPVIPRPEEPLDGDARRVEDRPPIAPDTEDQAEPRPDEPLTARAALRGTVSLPGGAPAAGARVRVIGSALLGFLEVGTNDRGVFELGALPPGFYEVQAFRGSFVAHAARGIQVREGESVEIDLSLVPGVAITGRVVSARTGEGIRGAEVRVSGELLDIAPRITETGADGSFVVPGLTPGPKVVRVHKEGYVHDGPTQMSPEEGDVLIRLGTEARLRLVIVDPRGAPVTDAEAQLLVEGTLKAQEAQAPSPRDRLLVVPGPVPPIPVAGSAPDARQAILASASSDADGDIALDGLPPARVRVRLSAVGRPTVIGEPVDLRPGKTTETQMTLPNGGTLSVRVFDAFGVRAENVDLAVRLEGDPIGAYARTDENGEAELEGLLGTMVVRASRGSSPPVVQRVAVGEGESRSVTITLGEARDELGGRVLDARGFGIAGATLDLATVSKRSPFSTVVRSESDGTFRFGELPPPPYRVIARHPAYADGDPVRVDALGVPLVLTLDPGGTIVGEVRDGRSREPVAAEVKLSQKARTMTGRVRSDGSFEIEHIPLGRWTFRLDDVRFVSYEAEIELVATGPRPPKRDLGRIDLVRAATVSGELVDAVGEPIYGARIIVGSGEHPESRTDEGGRFTVTRVAPGKQRVQATLDSGERVESALLSIREGDVREDVRLTARSRAETVEVPTSPTERLGVPITIADRGGRVAIEWVAPGSRAQKKGVRVGDKLLAVDGDEVLIAAQARPMLRASGDKPVRLRLLRDAKTLEVLVEPERFTPP